MELAMSLLEWYAENKRDLPWRKTKDPYAIWVSEIMLQQTRVDTAMDYYSRFIERFKNIRELADASEQDLLNVWKGLGYYARARNMHQTAKILCEKYCGSFPNDLIELRGLPGIGAYTAGAILSIAFGLPYCAVDGNVLRVISRIYGLSGDIAKEDTKKDISKRVQTLIPEKSAGEFTQALMELGALVCLPQSPDCAACPVCGLCTAYHNDMVDKLPVKVKKEKPNTIEDYWVILGIDGDKLLMEFRKNATLLKNMWGFPMIEKKEETELIKLLKVQYGVDTFEKIGTVRHIFTHKTWRMHGILVNRPKIPEGNFQYVNLSSLHNLPVPTSFKKVFRLLTNRNNQELNNIPK